MSKTKFIVGGWMHFLSSVREACDEELTEQQVKDMMKLYISGTSIEDALKEVVNG